MVKKTLLYTLLLLLIYCIFLRFLPKDLDTDQTQWSDNVIKGQKYLYDGQSFDNVIIGSSLSNRIITDTLGSNFKNLALGGLSIWDGFDVIEMKRNHKPKNVFIELNMVFRGSTQSYKDAISDRYLIKDKFNFLNDKNQPVGVLKGLLYNNNGGFKINYIEDSIKTNLNKEVLKVNEKDFSNQINADEISFRTKLFNEKILLLHKQGIKVFGFEIPMESPLCASNRMKIVRSIYPNLKNITFIPSVACENYHTNDGLHLNTFYTLKYTKYLKAEIKKLKL